MDMKPITWLTLFNRIGKQPLSRTRGQYVKCCIDEQMWYCRLVFTHNGSDFHLVPVGKCEEKIK